MRIILQISIVLAFFYFAQLMVLITLQYVPLNYHVSFLQLKSEINLLHYQISFFTHVYTSIFVLLLGFLQFIPFIRKKSKVVHRAIGISYIVLVLCFAAPSGLVMGYYGNGGFYSQFSFCLQAILWFIFTSMAYRFARKGNYSKHNEFMIYSFALTLSAISLRLFKWIIVGLWELPPMDTYKIVVWLGWVFNMILALLIVKVQRGKLVSFK